MNRKKLYRLYREEKLTVRKRGGRKRALGMRAPIELPGGPNERWSLDFVSDSFTDGRRFRILAIVDDFTRESLALIPDTSLSGARVARELDALIACRGRPKALSWVSAGTRPCLSSSTRFAARGRRWSPARPDRGAPPRSASSPVRRSPRPYRSSSPHPPARR